MSTMPSSVGHLADISQIAPALFLGNADAAADTDLLLSLDIVLVVNFADDLAAAGCTGASIASLEEYETGSMPSSPTRIVSCIRENKCIRVSFPLPDNPGEAFELLDFFASSALIEGLKQCYRGWARQQVLVDIEDGSRIRTGGILLHCVSGRNRSATVAAALLMSLHNCTARAALSWLQRVRPIVHPCSEYQLALLEYQAALQIALRATKGEKRKGDRESPRTPRRLVDADLCLLEDIVVSTRSVSGTKTLKHVALPPKAAAGEELLRRRRGAKRCAIM